MGKPRVALVTGGNRGLGFEVCRQLAAKGLQVLLCARSEEKAAAAAHQLEKEGLRVAAYPLDVTGAQSVATLEVKVRRTVGQVDILVNNAGVYYDANYKNDICTVDLEAVRAAMETNLYGPLRLCQAFVPMMKQRGYGRVVNVSTNMAQLETMTGGWPAYRFSKVALNALTRILADEVKGHNILVNAVSPGWVRTEMGGPQAPLSVEKGAETIVWLATLPDGGPTGGYFLDKKPLPW